MVISMVFDLLRGGVQPFLRFHPFPTIHTAPLASKPWSALCCHCSFFVLIWLDILQAIKTPREATWDHHSHFVHCEVQKKVLKSFSIAAGQRAQNSLLVESCACDSGYCGFELYHRLSCKGKIVRIISYEYLEVKDKKKRRWKIAFENFLKPLEASHKPPKRASVRVLINTQFLINAPLRA